MLGSGQKSFKKVSVTYDHHHQKKQMTTKDIPKGCLPIRVGQGEKQQKMVVPVIYLNHPLFCQLLKEEEEEYGFDQQGTITIPCHVEEFRYIQDLIDMDKEKYLQHHHHVVGCFRA